MFSWTDLPLSGFVVVVVIIVFLLFVKPNDELEFWLSPDTASASAASSVSKNKELPVSSAAAEVKHSRTNHESTDDDKPVVSVSVELESRSLLYSLNSSVINGIEKRTVAITIKMMNLLEIAVCYYCC